MAKKPHPPTDSETLARPVEGRRESVRSAEFFSTYANDVQVQTSPWDMHFIFGQVEGVAQTGEPVLHIKHLGELRISVQLAKSLTKIMIDQLKAYEERFGPIPEMPPS